MNELSAAPIPEEHAGAFFAQQESLHADYLRARARQSRTAWWVAGCAVVIAVLETTAMATLAPLHQVEWRLIRVDSSTGNIDVVNQLTDAPKSISDANSRYFLGQYVLLREGYAAPEVEHNFKTVSLMSSIAEQNRYADLVRGGNPNSPQVKFGKNGYVRIHVESVSLLGRGLGQVRYAREEQLSGGVPHTSQWIATVAYEWRPDAPMSNSDRDLNPLGFQVTDYHADTSQ